MCLGIPGRIVSIRDHALPVAKVAFGSIVKDVCLAYVPEARVGDYVIVHVGFAISRLDEAEAERTLRYLEQLGAPGDASPAEAESEPAPPEPENGP